MAIISGIVIKKLIKWKKSEKFEHTFEYTDANGVFWASIITTIGVLILSICLILGNIFGIIQNICMPELTILEYIQKSLT